MNTMTKRLIAASIDFLIPAALQGTAFIVILFRSVGEPISLKPLLVTTAITSILFLGKDSVRGRSLGKGVFKLRVVSESDQKSASPAVLFARNLTIPLWPLEIIALIKSGGEKRLGDYLFRTTVNSEE